MNRSPTLISKIVKKDHCMEFNRLTWIGFIAAAGGWAVLLVGATVSKDAWKLSEYFGATAPSLSVVNASTSMIVSGFSLAILGALQSCFSALHRFLEVVLQGSQRAQAQAETAMKQIAKLSSNKGAEEGWMGNRAYVRFANGTVQIKTLLGVRNFASFDEAREFVGS